MVTAEEFEAYFQGIDLPEPPISLTTGETITDVPSFIEAQIITIKNAGNEKIAAPPRDRLLKLIQIMEDNNS